MKALVFEDDLELSRSIRLKLVRWGYEVVTANDVDTVYGVLREEGAPQIAIVDCRNGYALVKKIRKFAPGNYVFVLAITSDNRETNLLEAMEAGANDCLTQPFEEKALKARLRAAQRVIELEQALTAKAALDPLTGVYNREAIIQWLEKELARSKRDNSSLAIAMVDLDHFKKINDTFGHLAGDSVLKRAVQCMSKSLRKYDVLGRYGGEEFLILLPGCDSSKVVAVGERVREKLARTKFNFAGHETTVTASIGVAVTKAGEFDSPLLIELADQALYRAKAAGRNRVESAHTLFDDAVESMVSRDAIHEQLRVEIAHRKQTEEALEESKKWFEMLSTVSPVGIFRTDKEGNCVYVNSCWSLLTGLTREESYGKGWIGAVHPEDRERILSGLNYAIDHHKPFKDEARFKRPDGVVTWVMGQCVAVLDEAGTLMGSIGTITDITELKRSEMVQSVLFRISEAANFSHDMQQLYKTIHSLVGELMYAGNFYIALYDAQTKLISFPYWVDEVDPAAPDPMEAERGLTAYVIREGKPLLSTAEDWDEFKKSGDVQLVGAYSLDWLGVPLISEEQTIGVVVVQSYTSKIRYTEKDKDLLTFVSQHIAAALKRKRSEEDRKRAEEAVRESEEKYRALFETSRDPIFISTAEGTLLDINPAGVELFGYSSRNEMLEINTAELFQDPAQRIAYKEAIQAQGFLKDYELNLKRKDGQKVTVLETASAITNENGVVFAYRGVMRDITNLKLLQQQLLQSQKIETVGRLAGGVAHDFNNLLMAITGYCELINLKYRNDERLMQYMKEIEKATELGAGLTRQLLAFSRKQVVVQVPIDLNVLIKNMDRMIDRMLAENIKLNLRLHSGISRILGDPGQIEQVIMNLVVNARDAMSNAGVLTIETQDTELSPQFTEQHLGSTPGQYVLLKITDTGCGMDESTRSRIFEPFFSTKELGKGTGLGLATVYGIVQQMAGFIVVSSEPAKGTSFEIYFPRNAEPVRQENQVVAQPAEALKGKEVLLLVDDNETVRAAVGASLSLYGYKVLQAGDGIEAIQVAADFTGQIHLLITDVVMPNMNGRQVATELVARWPTLKVLYMSGYADETFFESGKLDAGAYFLQKPVATKILLTTIRQLLD